MLSVNMISVSAEFLVGACHCILSCRETTLTLTSETLGVVDEQRGAVSQSRTLRATDFVYTKIETLECVCLGPYYNPCCCGTQDRQPRLHLKVKIEPSLSHYAQVTPCAAQVRRIPPPSSAPVQAAQGPEPSERALARYRRGARRQGGPWLGTAPLPPSRLLGHLHRPAQGHGKRKETRKPW